MSLGDQFGLASGFARFDNMHGRSENGMQGGSFRYPSPFFDIGHTYLPTSVKQMFKWCRYYFLTNPLINAVTYKMAEYPITPMVVDEDDSQLRDVWKEILEHQLKIRTFQIETGLDYFCYGNAFVTIHFPFEKYLICGNCKKRVKITKAKYKFRNLKYHLFCEQCEVQSEAKVDDVNIKSLKKIRLIRWNPEYMDVEHNDVTGESVYFFSIPNGMKNDIMMGKRHIVETVPHVFIESLQQQKHLRFTADNLFHLKRPTIAQKDMGWGMPLILPVLKDTYYLQILRKAQEAIALQHVVPLRILFPQPGSASADPYSTTDLGMWRKRIEAEIQQWRMDPNYIPILPLPIGNETVGGEGKALMLHQEMRAWSEQIVAGMHVPIEFVFGGLQYSGSNVSMRMLENQFLGYRTNQLIMVRDFIVGRIADYMEWKRPKLHFKRFKMADDLQRSSLVFQMNQAMKVSDTTLMDELDFDIVQEEKHKAAELNKQLENQRKMQMAQAALQGEVGIIQARYQAQAQKVMAQLLGGMPGAPGQDPTGKSSGDPINDAIKQMGEENVAGAGMAGGGAGGGGGGGSEAQNPAGGAMMGTETQQPDQGSEAAPGMPDTATAYPEKGQQAPTEGIPSEMQSPLNANQKGGAGYNLLYLARRASTDLEKKDDATRYVELMKMKGANPQMYTLVLQLLSSGKGSQTDPLDALQSPMPQFKPPRRPSALV